MNSGVTAASYLALIFGLACGIGSYVFVYAQGGSYLTDRPQACANCHIMREYFSGWLKSSHRAVAVCNDCHTPEGIAEKYLTKAMNGFRHSWAFTTSRFPEPLQIKPDNRRILEQKCRYCHQDIIQAIEAHPSAGTAACVRCHDSVGHL